MNLVGRPPYDQTMTVTSSDPTHFLLTTDPTVLGSASINVLLTQNDPYIPAIYLQGQNFSGTSAIRATITASAPSYSTNTGSPALYPTGIALLNTAITATANSFSYVLNPTVVALDPATLGYYNTIYKMNPQIGPISVTVTSSNPSVGGISNAQVTIPAGQGAPSPGTYPAFTPLSPGSTTITVSEPPGFQTPAGYYSNQVSATVTN
jgi:hypothetical protein